jgi:IclR family acetate operon transcriptional repressor
MTTTQPIQSLDRGLVLLEAVADAQRPVSLSELMPVLGIDRSSVFRLANTLVRRGFLVQEPASKRYLLGSSIWRLASLFRFEHVLLQVSRPHVDALAADTGETTYVAIREDTQAVLIDRQLTEQALGVMGAGLGTGMPLHCTGVGKALLADFEYDRLVGLIGKSPLKRFTKRTIATLDALAEACGQTRACGFAVDDEEGHEGVRCIGAPIRDVSGTVVAAVGISAPVARLPREAVKKTGARVAAAAEAIGRDLGHGNGTTKKGG